MTHVLVVDDEIGIRNLLSEILEDQGYGVFTACDAQSAREQLKAVHIDLILLDIWMPDTDGITLLKELVSTRVLNCPVIMMSGHGTIETAMEAMRYGAMGFLEKPIGMKQLMQTLERVLEDWKSVNHADLSDVVRYPRLVGNVQHAPTTEPSVPATPVEPRIHEQPASGPSSSVKKLKDVFVVSTGEPSASVQRHFPLIEIPELGIVLNYNQPYRELIKDIERAYFSRVLAMYHGQVVDVSNHTQLERTHVYRKLKSLGLEPSLFSRESGLKEKDLPVYGSLEMPETPLRRRQPNK